jgi:hypothetical protein
LDRGSSPTGQWDVKEGEVVDGDEEIRGNTLRPDKEEHHDDDSME